MKGDSFINLTDTDDKAGAFLLATAITTGVSDAVGFREYMMDPSRGIDILSAISPSLGAKASAGKLGKNISDAITSEDNGSSTGTLALINGMKKLNGDPDFNISDYMTIDKDGDIDLKDYQEGEPLTITQLRYAEKNSRVSDMIAGQMQDEIKCLYLLIRFLINYLSIITLILTKDTIGMPIHRKSLCRRLSLEDCLVTWQER